MSRRASLQPSPTKIVFNYANQPQQQNTVLSNSMFSPRIIQSGFILGQPVAYTGVPQLPSQFRAFSPRASRPRATTDFLASSRRLLYQAPEPSRFAPPTRSPRAKGGVSHQDFNRLLHKYKELQTRYKQLEQRYFDLQSRQSSSVFYHQDSHKSTEKVDLIQLIQRYKGNLMDEFKLLMDRTRLQEKELQYSRMRG